MDLSHRSSTLAVEEILGHDHMQDDSAFRADVLLLTFLEVVLDLHPESTGKISLL